MKKNYFAYYDIIVAGFVSCLLVSNLAATKLVAIGSFILDGGAILFPLTYILGDVLTEVYGFKYARRTIWTGFIGMIIAVLSFTAVRYMPFPPEYADQRAFESVLGFFPRIVAASLVAYLVGEFMNAYVLAKLKLKTRGKKMWLRLIGSTVIGELFDTVIFCLVAFGGILKGNDMLNYIAVGWIFKVLVEIILLPVTYRVISILKHAESSDANDANTDFTPLSISINR